MTQSLSGYGALITAGGGGLGSSFARRLAQDGATVTMMGRTEATLVAAAAQISADLDDPGRIKYFVGDALLPEDVARAVDVAATAPDGLKICVAGVGGGVIGPLLNFTEADAQDQFNRNVVSAFTAIKWCTPAMVTAGGGSIVCISSEAAKLSWPFMALYSAAKAGLDGLVRAAAAELGPLGVRVNAVRPGLTRTGSVNVSAIFADADLLAKFVGMRPLGRAGEPIDVAEGVRYLAGPESSWVTGQSLGIDGGAELRQPADVESIVRARFGDELVDQVQAGRLPG
jgi:NAD(P)-dependent dehydrogenase (short-subunit alcohol dehydrogenase family)